MPPPIWISNHLGLQTAFNLCLIILILSLFMFYSIIIKTYVNSKETVLLNGLFIFDTNETYGQEQFNVALLTRQNQHTYNKTDIYARYNWIIISSYTSRTP